MKALHELEAERDAIVRELDLLGGEIAELRRAARKATNGADQARRDYDAAVDRGDEAAMSAALSRVRAAKAFDATAEAQALAARRLELEARREAYRREVHQIRAAAQAEYERVCKAREAVDRWPDQSHAMLARLNEAAEALRRT